MRTAVTCRSSLLPGTPRVGPADPASLQSEATARPGRTGKGDPYLRAALGRNPAATSCAACPRAASVDARGRLDWRGEITSLVCGRRVRELCGLTVGGEAAPVRLPVRQVDVLYQERPVFEDAHVDQRRIGPALDAEEHDEEDDTDSGAHPDDRVAPAPQGWSGHGQRRPPGQETAGYSCTAAATSKLRKVMSPSQISLRA
jgi:hypothetical protein